MRNVYIFPNGLHLDGIPGYLSIINDGQDCITWTPSTEEPKQTNSGLAPMRRSDIYAMRIPVDDIWSIRQSFPKFGQPNIVIVVKENVSLNPFYFYEGGIKEFLRILQKLKNFAPSDYDPNLYTLVESPLPFGHTLPPPPSESTPNQPPYSPTHPTFAHSHLPQSTSYPQLNQHNNFPQQSPTAQAWSFLSGVKKLAKDATAIWYEDEANQPKGNDARQYSPLNIDDFEIVKDPTAEALSRISLAEQAIQKEPREEPLSSEEWINSFDKDGRIRNVDSLRKKIYNGGMEPSLRPEAWKYLLGYYPFNSTFEERELIKEQKKLEYSIYQSQWESITEEQESHFSKFRALKENIMKDVVRTDRTWQIYEADDSPQLQEIYRILLTYAFFNFDIGYVQGMNDLVSVLLIVTQNEVDAFWCFKGLMDRIMDNFDKDQVGMHTQLTQLSEIVKFTDPELYQHLLEAGGTNMFFCFKWLLIVFKREFPLNDVQRIWEVLWSDYYTTHHQLFICLAMLLNAKQKILEENMEFDDILRHLNSTSKTMDVEVILIEADYLYKKFITICDTKTQNEILQSKVPPPVTYTRKRSV